MIKSTIILSEINWGSAPYIERERNFVCIIGVIEEAYAIAEVNCKKKLPVFGDVIIFLSLHLYTL